VAVPFTVTWLAVYSLFFLFWMPTNLEFWLPQALCIWILVANWVGRGSLAESRRAARSLLAAALILAAVNFAGSVMWARDPDNDYYRHAVAPLVGIAGAHDLIVTGRAWILPAYAEHFTGSRVISVARTLRTSSSAADALEVIANEVQTTRAAGGRVFVDDGVVHVSPEVRRESGPDIEIVARTWAILADSPPELRGEYSNWYVLQPESH
jgi:hypothetical protein